MTKDDFALMAFEPGKRYIVLLDKRAVDMRDQKWPEIEVNDIDVTFLFIEPPEGKKVSDMTVFSEVVADKAAVIVERERCAKIAESTTCVYMGPKSRVEGFDLAKEWIAKKIRSGE